MTSINYNYNKRRQLYILIIINKRGSYIGIFLYTKSKVLAFSTDLISGATKTKAGRQLY